MAADLYPCFQLSRGGTGVEVNSRQHFAKAGRRHGRAPLGLKQVTPVSLLAPQSPQCPKLLAAERMHRRDAMF
jgi:hypothetical protein